jgi:uncharacterized OsmC-like protein
VRIVNPEVATSIELKRVIHFDGDLSTDQRARLVEIAEKCPVHRTLTSEIEIQSREINGLERVDPRVSLEPH